MPGAALAGGHRHLAGPPPARARRGEGGMLAASLGLSSGVRGALDSFLGAAPLPQQRRDRSRGPASPWRPGRFIKEVQMMLSPASCTRSGFWVPVLLESCCFTFSGPSALPAGEYWRSWLTAVGSRAPRHIQHLSNEVQILHGPSQPSSCVCFCIGLGPCPALAAPGSTLLFHPFILSLPAGTVLSPRALLVGSVRAKGCLHSQPLKNTVMLYMYGVAGTLCHYRYKKLALFLYISAKNVRGLWAGNLIEHVRLYFGKI